MMPAMGCVVALAGATEADLALVNSVFDELHKCESFDPVNGPGNVIAVDALETVKEFDIGFDLNKPGELRVVIDNHEAKISHEESDRHALIKQLILMCCGDRFVDADLADIMPVLESGCCFSWAKSTEESLLEDFKKLLEQALNGADTHDAKLYLQLTNVSGLACCNLEQEENDFEDYGDYVAQIICESGLEEGECIIALFCAGKS